MVIVDPYRFGYTFSNSAAKTYFDALETAGFTETQSQSLYSLSFNSLKGAVDTYFQALATAGINTKIIGDYLVIGGTAATHAINAADPGTFDGTFMNSPTHGAGGVTANGTSQYMKTGLIPNLQMTINDTHLGVYSRTNTINLNPGVQVSITERIRFNLKTSGDETIVDHYRTNNGGRITASNTNSQGHFIITRVANNDNRLAKNGSQLGTTNTNTTVGSIPTKEIYLFGAVNNNGSPAYYAGQWSGGQAGSGLTIAETLSHYNALQVLQTTLGRQV